MLVRDSDEPALKSWLEKRLAKISDAEAPILAEYCIALLKHDQSEDQVRDLCVEQLSDFLRGDTKAFVNDVFTAIKSRTFSKDGSLKIKQPQVDVQMKTAPSTMTTPAVTVPKPVARPPHSNQAAQFPVMPMPPPELLNDPAFLMHMQQMAQAMQPQPARRKRKHCFAFEQRGFCNKGSACPYEHVPATTQQPERNLHEYDPNFSGMSGQTRGQPFVRSTYQNQNGLANVNVNANDGRMRSTRPTSNGSGETEHGENSILSLKNVPAESLSEAAVRQYFEVFGPLASVRINVASSSAIIKFIDPQNAQSAYDSPAPIFNNRFVKLFWLNRNSKSNPAKQSVSRKHNDDAMEIDAATIETKQREHDDRAVKKRAFEERAALLAAQKAELQRRQDESREQLARMQSFTASKTSHNVNSPNDIANGIGNGTSDSNGNGTMSDTSALEAQLAQLKAKASALGLTQDDLTAAPSSKYAGRAVRGRGNGRGRGASGRGYSASSRGRGGAPYVRRTLDLRPRTLRIETPDAAHLESEIRASTDYEAITKPEEGALHVTFKTRHEAEQFSVRKVGAMSWVKDIPIGDGGNVAMDDVDANHNRYDD